MNLVSLLFSSSMGLLALSVGVFSSPFFNNGEIRTQIIGDELSNMDPQYLRASLSELAQAMRTQKRGFDFVGSRGKKSDRPGLDVRKKVPFYGSRGKKSYGPFDAEASWYSAIPVRDQRALRDLDLGSYIAMDAAETDIPMKRGIEFLGSRGKKAASMGDFDIRFGKRGPTFIGSRG